MADKKAGMAVGIGLAAAIGGIIYLTTRAKAAPPPPPGLSTLYGIVTDAETGQPIPGVQVVLGGVGTTTNTSGQYSFAGDWLVPGSYTIIFSKDGYVSLTL